MAQVYLSQYSRRAAVADSVDGTASYADVAGYINPIRLDPIEDPNPTGLLYPTSTYLYQSSSNTTLGYDLYIRQDGNLTKWKWIEGMLNTGLLYGGVLSYSASSFLITPGAGLIVNHNAVTGSEIGPMIEYVTWGPITQSIENIATYQNTFVYIDVSGSASQQNVFFTPEQYQNYIPIGRVSHYDNIEANNSYENVQTVYDIDGQQNIFVRAFGPLKLKGIATSGQAGTLRLNISSGTAFNLGGYYPFNPETPSTYNMETYNTASIIRIYRNGTGDYVFDDNGGSYYTTIDPGNYDDGTGILASVGNGEWSIQRVMVNPVTGRAHVYYSQNVYPTFDDAIGAIFSDEFVESDATAFTYPFSAYLILKGNTIDLLNAENEIVQAGLFRSTAGGGGTGGGGIPGGQDTQIQFNNAGVFDGEPEFTFNPSTNIVTLTGSMFVSGAISASFGPGTVGFYGTASWAVSASKAISSSYAFSASYALSSSRATTASYALTASFATTASYASSSPNFANTNLVFTNNRNHNTSNYHYFIYSNLIGGSGTSPFDGFAVSGGFHFFNSGSNVLGVAQNSTSTYTYVNIITQSIDLRFTADPAAPSSYNFTHQQAYFSSSLNVTKSVYFPGLTSGVKTNVVVVDTASGQLYYLPSSSLGGAAANIAASSSGVGLTATVVSIDFVGAGVSASSNGNDVTVTIPGGAGVAGGNDTQIQFNSGSAFSGSGYFSFDYNNNIVYLTGSSAITGSSTLTGSMFVSGAISASFGPGTVGFFGTASWAQNASQSISSSYALSASYASTSDPAPSNTYVQYNNNGVFGASNNFKFDYTNNIVQILGRLEQAGGDATGTGAHAEGNKTIASGDYSHAEGDTTLASGEGAHAAGLASQALGKYQSVIGQYNATSDSRSAFIIGDGVDGSNRHNVLFASQSWFEVSASNVFLKGLSTTSEVHILVYNTSSGQLYYLPTSSIGGGGGSPTPPANPVNSIQFNNAGAFGGSSIFTFNGTNTVYLTGSYITSGSSVVTGSASVLGTSSINGIALIGTSSAQALYTTAKITTINGTNTIYSLQTASYDGAFFDYTLISGADARAGQIMSIWSGSEVRYTETTTTDIGSTSDFTFSVAITAGSASLQCITTTAGAIIKTIIKGI